MKKFNIGIRELKEALFYLGFAVDTKTYQPALRSILADVRANKIVFTATNTQITIVHEVVWQNESEFKILLSFAELKSISALCVNDLTISQSDNKITIEYGKDKFSLTTTDKIEDFPVMTEANFEKPLELPEDFFSSIGLASISVLPDTKLDEVCENICLELAEGKMSVTATDKRILFSKELPVKFTGKNKTAFIPKRAADIIKSLSDGYIQFGDKVVLIKSDNTSIIIQHPHGKFPDWRLFVSFEVSGKIKIPSNTLRIVQSNASVLSKDNAIIKFSVTKESANVCTVGEENNYETAVPIESSWEGDIAFNADWLYKVLSQIKSEVVTISINTPDSAVSILDGEDMSTTILMSTMQP